MMLVQLGGGLSAQKAGMLTLGYAIAIVAFIRVGEKLLQKFGARKPMIWGSLIVGLSIAMLMPTNLLIGQYTMLAVAAYTLLRFGPGVLRDAFDRCGALEPARRPGRIRIRHLQDGVVTRRLVRCRDLSRDLYGAQRRPGIDSMAGRRDHVRRSSGQRGHPPGSADRVGAQSAHGRGGHRIDHAHRTQRAQNWRLAMNALVNEFKGRLETIKAWRHHLHNIRNCHSKRPRRRNTSPTW